MKGNARARHDNAPFHRGTWLENLGYGLCVACPRERGISFDTTDGNNESAGRREATCFLRRILIRNAELGLLNLPALPTSNT